MEAVAPNSVTNGTAKFAHKDGWQAREDRMLQRLAIYVVKNRCLCSID